MKTGTAKANRRAVKRGNQIGAKLAQAIINPDLRDCLRKISDSDWQSVLPAMKEALEKIRKFYAFMPPLTSYSSGPAPGVADPILLNVSHAFLKGICLPMTYDGAFIFFLLGVDRRRFLPLFERRGITQEFRISDSHDDGYLRSLVREFAFCSNKFEHDCASSECGSERKIEVLLHSVGTAIDGFIALDPQPALHRLRTAIRLKLERSARSEREAVLEAIHLTKDISLYGRSIVEAWDDADLRFLAKLTQYASGKRRKPPPSFCGLKPIEWIILTSWDTELQHLNDAQAWGRIKRRFPDTSYPGYSQLRAKLGLRPKGSRVRQLSGQAAEKMTDPKM